MFRKSNAYGRDLVEELFAERRADALRVYKSARETLTAELGLEPRFDPEITRRYVFSAINGLPLWYRADGPATAEEIADAYGELVVGTVLSAYAAPTH